MQGFDAFGDRLKQLRESLGYTQNGISVAVGSKLRSWQDYEKGERVPGAQVIAGLASLGVNTNWLLTGEGPVMLNKAAPGELDHDLMALVIDSVEEGLKAQGVIMKPGKTSGLILAIYDMYADSDAKPEKSKILNLVKSAA